MKNLAALLTLVASFIISNAYGCDEKCQKEKAEQANNVKFPGYVTWGYCDDIRMEFMTTTLGSVGNYVENNFDMRYKGGLRNTRNFLAERKEWLQECDQYLQMTGKGHIFETEKTTKQIYAAIDKLTKEFDDLLAGITYSAESGQDSGTILLEKYRTLFKTVDNHKTLMHLKGKYVVR
ncbi:hypothetical protein QFX18_13695 [Saccharophagus degradans]|uniref:hypothetical protein n=1 Tax=Saccharophagus degradans TaxID=86304 RepID=UPI002477EEB7|nr:hypothetical protein [Saccharophagus degradans]WGO97095.1 hypothetical protein QFX18_13695 [Saccharophagus degradans]